MNVKDQVKNYLISLPGEKKQEMQVLHQRMLQLAPGIKLWFEDGRNAENKTVANPNIGYGTHTIQYANGKTKDCFRVGISANQTGISVYIIGIKEKNYLAQTYAKRLGKAKVTGYCIKFKTLKDIDPEILDELLRDMLDHSV